MAAQVSQDEMISFILEACLNFDKEMRTKYLSCLILKLDNEDIDLILKLIHDRNKDMETGLDVKEDLDDTMKIALDQYIGIKDEPLDTNGQEDLPDGLEKQMLCHSADIKPIQCEQCDKSYKVQSQLKVHMQIIHSNEKLYKCDLCSKFFATKGQFSSHNQIHIGKKQFACNICSKQFLRLNHLKPHILEVHQKNSDLCDLSGIKPYKCVECGACFSESRSLRLHYKLHLGKKVPLDVGEINDKLASENPKDFKPKPPRKRPKQNGKKLFSILCDYCPKTFSTEYFLKQHLTIHTGEKPHSCDLCSMKFRLKSTLRIHKIRHTGGKLLCDICAKPFVTSTDLKMHKINHHSNDKAHKCDQCDKAFAAPAQLKRHMVSHTGEKSFLCEICHKTFAYNHHLNRHMLKHNEVL